MCQWFLDRMDTQWLSNKKRFLDKIDMMDASFCTTAPKSLNIPSKYAVFYIPNPVDESFEKLENYKNKKINFLSGYTDGVSSDIKEKSDLVLSLSPLTFPHELARLILIEQIYRAISISNNSPYHRS